MKFCIKFFESEFGKVLFICDSNLIGKELKEGKISVKIKKELYEKIVEKNEANELIKKSDILNVFGNESLKLVKKHFKIKKILYIEKVPHVQIYKI